jgi:hypothetical protein
MQRTTFWMMALMAASVLHVASCASADDKKSGADTAEPDTTVPDTTVPDTTVPDTTDPDVPCTPTCGLKQCGDDGCGSVCGTCGDSQICTDGMCVDDTGPPCGECPEGMTCGGDPEKPKWCSADECGDVTYEGQCAEHTVLFCDNDTLYAINCVAIAPEKINNTCALNEDAGYYDCSCEADCSGDPCGDDGCGGTCSECPEGQNCDEAGQCCTPDCSSDPCGDDGCGGTCDVCPGGQYCNDEAQCADFAATKGNTCAVPIVVDALPFEDAGDSSTHQDVYTTGAGCQGEQPVGEGKPDVVYQYTATETGPHTAGLADNQAGATIITVTTDCADLDAGCTAYSGDLFGDKSFTVELTAGTTYFFIADGLYPSDVGGYVFTLSAGGTCTPACDGKNCGDDLCGSVCGSCADSQICDADGQCVDDVVPPIPGDGVDLSGLVLQQTNSDKSYTIPEGTVVPVGGSLVIGRKAGQEAFATFWGIADVTTMTYIDSGNKFQSLNGDETYAITDGAGMVWDGPSPVMEEGFNYQRTDAKAPSSEATSWVVTNILVETKDPTTDKLVTSTLADVATPGSTTTTGPAIFPVVITEISDAVGNNNYVYEFIEITVFAVD